MKTSSIILLLAGLVLVLFASAYRTTDAETAYTVGHLPATFMVTDTGVPYLPGIISTTDQEEGGLHITQNGDTYFWRRTPGEKQQLYMLPKSESRGDRAGEETSDVPQRLPFSTDRDENAFLTKDGLTLFFGSERPIPGRSNLGNFDMNVWVVTRPSLDADWSAPRPLPAPFNEVQAEGEVWPMANASRVFSLDDSVFYVNMHRRSDSTSRLYRYRRTSDNNLVNPEVVSGFFADPRFSVGGVTLSPDGRYLFFSSYGAPGGEGGEDLYVSRIKSDGAWSAARPLTSINTPNEEAGPYISPDGKTLFFGKAYLIDKESWTYSPWSIYTLPMENLHLEALFAEDLEKEKGPGTGMLKLPKPVPFAPEILAKDNAWTLTPSLSTDGKLMAFVRWNKPVLSGPDSNIQQLYLSSRSANDAWGEPYVVEAFSNYRVDYPHFSPDGNFLYLSSTRPHPGQYKYPDPPYEDFDLWRVPMQDNAVDWTAAEVVPCLDCSRTKTPDNWNIRYVNNETSPRLDLAGNLYYWTERIGSGGLRDVYSAAPLSNGNGFGKEVRLPFNSLAKESGVAVSRDGSTLFFASERASSSSSRDSDLYRVERTATGWSEPTLVPGASSSYRESSPELVGDSLLVFTSDRPIEGVEVVDAGEESLRIGVFSVPVVLEGRVK